MPIKAPRETTNLMAAQVNVGVGTGEKAGAATFAGRMVNTFKTSAGLGKLAKEIRAVVLHGGRLSGRSAC